ncbi:MAG TPA: sugar phosphate nucleotidyltransferase [Pirellulales bacterium]|nr:sugar phosphate nucleotidyltransferase [Pirellulales bacterium]
MKGVIGTVRLSAESMGAQGCRTDQEDDRLEMNPQGHFKKGIILAQSAGTRLYPVTAGISKSLVPIYDKPMIYYPLSVLILAGVREVLIVSTFDDIRSLERLLGDGSKLGMRIEYAAKAIDQVNILPIGRRFLRDENVAVILADQLLYGYRFELALLQAVLRPAGATIFTKGLIDPRHYDIVEFGPTGQPTRVAPNPEEARGNAAIVGFYLFDRHVGSITADLRSRRDDQVTFSDIAGAYLERGNLHVVQLDIASAWFDIGTHEVQMSASVFVEMIQNELGRSIGCIEEAAYLRKLITAERLLELSAVGGNDYCRYLRRIARCATPQSRDS